MHCNSNPWTRVIDKIDWNCSKRMVDCAQMRLGSFHSWINCTIYCNSAKKKPLKSSVSKGICVSRSRWWHVVTTASLGCTGDHLPKAKFSYSPLVTVQGMKCQCCQLHMLLLILSFFLWVVISEHLKSLNFPLSPKSGKEFLTVWLEQLGTWNPHKPEVTWLGGRLQWLVAW